MMRAVLTVSAVMLLAACGDKPQSASGTKRDALVYQGGVAAYNAPGWKAGEKTSWEQQLKARTQAGQNEYNRVSN